MRKYIILLGVSVLYACSLRAQTYTSYTTTENETWKVGKETLKNKTTISPILEITGNEDGMDFRAWGTTFNELDWDAFNLLTREEQDEVMYNLFSPEGDLRFTHGRVSMNANDYARSWYSCSEVSGDFELRYFNIERDKRNIIPLARAAQKYCPKLQLRRKRTES